MGNNVQYITPGKHRGENWDKIIGKIPKEKNSYCEQIKYFLKHFNGRNKSEDFNILDIGGGEGTFTKMVVEILKDDMTFSEDKIKLFLLEGNDKCAAIYKDEFNKSMPYVQVTRLITGNKG